MAVDGGLRKLFRKHLKQVHMVTVETGATQRGVPDINVCGDGVECWIECKATKSSAVKMRTEQVGWHLTRTRRGGRAFIAVRVQVKKTARQRAADELVFYPSESVRDVRDLGVLAPGRLGCWTGGPAAWDWNAVRALLLAPQRP